jgi:hypothetical protein
MMAARRGAIAERHREWGQAHPRTAVTAVLAVAAVAALISYRHAVVVVTSHGEPGMVSHLYPVLIDGLIVAAWPAVALVGC